MSGKFVLWEGAAMGDGKNKRVASTHTTRKLAQKRYEKNKKKYEESMRPFGGAIYHAWITESDGSFRKGDKFLEN